MAASICCDFCFNTVCSSLSSFSRLADWISCLSTETTSEENFWNTDACCDILPSQFDRSSSTGLCSSTLDFACAKLLDDAPAGAAPPNNDPEVDAAGVEVAAPNRLVLGVVDAAGLEDPKIPPAAVVLGCAVAAGVVVEAPNNPPVVAGVVVEDPNSPLVVAGVGFEAPNNPPVLAGAVVEAPNNPPALAGVVVEAPNNPPVVPGAVDDAPNKPPVGAGVADEAAAGDAVEPKSPPVVEAG
jgi:hypothetical protein